MRRPAARGLRDMGRGALEDSEPRSHPLALEDEAAQAPAAGPLPEGVDAENLVAVHRLLRDDKWSVRVRFGPSFFPLAWRARRSVEGSTETPNFSWIVREISR